MARTLALLNNKGGTGKTTTTLGLGAALARRRQRVLLIDLDSQRNLSAAFTLPEGYTGIGRALVDSLPLHEAMVKVDKQLWVLGSTPALVDYEYQLSHEPGREFILREALAPLQSEFDFILLDCAPSLGTLTVNALTAADGFIVPMQAENFAFLGLDRILETADKAKRRMNPKLELEGILFVKLNPRTTFSKAVVQSLAKDPRTAGRVFHTYIRQDIALMECSAFQKSVFEYAPSSNGAHDYADLARELLQRTGNQSGKHNLEEK